MVTKIINLFSDIIIDKQHQKIKELKLYANQAFKPSLMVSIEKFELRLDFGEARPNGPMIRQNFTRHIKGSYGWLYEIEDLITTNTSDIHKVDLSESD